MTLEEAIQRSRQAVKWAADRITTRREGSLFGRSVGKSRQHVHELRKSPDPPLSRALIMASWLGLSLEELLEESWDKHQRRPCVHDEIELLHRQRKKPRILTKAHHRLDTETIPEGDRPMRSRLARIDELRYRNPVIALDRLEMEIEDLPADQIAFALNIVSSCYRMLLDFSASSVCLRQSQEMANRTKNRIATGDNLQRWVYLLVEADYRSAALRRCRKATEIFIETGPIGKIGETLVDRGYCYYQLSQYKQAQACYERAGELAEHLTLRYDVAWRQGLAVTLSAMGKVHEARTVCHAANKIAESSKDSLILGHGLRLLGRLEARLGHLRRSEDWLLSAAKLLDRHTPLDALLATLEIYRLHLELKSPPPTPRAVNQLAKFIDPLSDLPALCHHLEDLVALIRLRRLAIENLDAVTSAIVNSRPRFFRLQAKTPWRTPRRRSDPPPGKPRNGLPDGR